jgi:DNA polymerase-3 subunit beta
MKNQKTIKAHALLTILKFIGGIIPKNPAVVVLENFLFHNGRVTAFNLQTQITYNTGVAFGTFVVPAKELIKVLSNIPKTSEIYFTPDTDTRKVEIFIADSNKKFKFQGEDPENFPRMPICKTSAGTLTHTDIEKIKSVLPFVSDDDSRPAMTGININGEIAATDGHRMKWVKSSGKTKKDFGFILPAGVAKLLKEENYQLNTGESNGTKYIELYTDTYSITTKPIDERYPDYQNAIPKENPISVNIEKKDFLESLNLALLAANKTTHQIRIGLKIKEVEISSECLDSSTEFSDTLPAAVFGNSEKFDIGFNGEFLKEFVEDIEGEKLTFEFSRPNRPAIINNTRLLMPVMLSDYK